VLALYASYPARGMLQLRNALVKALQPTPRSGPAFWLSDEGDRKSAHGMEGVGGTMYKNVSASALQFIGQDHAYHASICVCALVLRGRAYRRDS
jgi:hypothetical protein